MTKQEFAEKLALQAGISKATALQAIDCIFSTKAGEGIIATELDAGRRLTVTGFGTFATRGAKQSLVPWWQGTQDKGGQDASDTGTGTCNGAVGVLNTICSQRQGWFHWPPLSLSSHDGGRDGTLTGVGECGSARTPTMTPRGADDGYQRSREVVRRSQGLRLHHT